MENEIEVRNGVTIEKKRVYKMISRILLAERINHKTKDKNESEMVTQIQKIIEEEVKCL
ncbi:MAG: hypothetical protein JG777_2150 [Clostridia bacterium]|jgi:hypothetical protein|nr:hypothetical protein [Clostridia bacterium]